MSEEKKPITFYTNIIDALTNSILTGIEFAQIVAIKRNQQPNMPEYNFNNQTKKILEEVREYVFAVASRQGEEKEHTREKQVEEGLDLYFATLSSYDTLKITREEIREAVTTCIVKFQDKGWLD